jgi:hypothetical protein
MGKLITFVLAIAVIAGAAYYALNHAAAGSSSSGEPSSARRQLDNVRGAASRIESEADQRAQQLQEKMQDGQ